MINRVSGIILKDKKLLLVTNKDEPFYWTPGGKAEAGETNEAALKRELMEEVGLQLITYTPYLSYETPYHLNDQERPDTTAKVLHYLITCSGDITLGAEIKKMIWYSREDFEKGIPKIGERMRLHLIPQLIIDGLL